MPPSSRRLPVRPSQPPFEGERAPAGSRGASGAGTVLPIAERLAADPRFSGRGVTAAFLDSGFFAHPDLMQPICRVRAYHDVLSGRSGVDLVTAPDESS